MPKVSVIIPAYNAEKYIAETLDSVVNQTYSDFEVIIVDDGSKDGTVSIIKQYQGKYPEKIRLIQKENGGPASARNVGIKVATGEYIAFIDADDLWLPRKLEKQISFFESQPTQVGLVYTDGKKFDDDGTWTLPEHLRHNYIEGRIYKDLLRSNVIPNQSVVVRNECFDQVGLFSESPKIVSSEDYDMWLRIARKFEISFLNEVLSLYREHNLGISKRYEQSINANIAVLENHLKMADGNKELEYVIKDLISQDLFSLGYYSLKDGNKTLARSEIGKSLNIRYDFKRFLTKLSTYLPTKLLIILNRFIKSVAKPAEIVKSKEDFNKLMTLHE